jgi:putative ABC transport system permease protein
MDTWTADLLYSIRSLLRRRRFTATAIVILTLGIGAGTAVFSFVNAILVRPLPYQDPDRLTLLWATFGRNNQVTVSWPEFESWKSQLRAFEQVSALGIGSFTLSGGAAPGSAAPAPEDVIAGRVSPDLFQMLGVHPLLGRTLMAGDDAETADRVVVLGYQLWQQRFGGQRDVIGRAITLNDQVYTVAGVMPREFWFLLQDFQLWTPLQPTPAQRTNADARGLYVAGRLRADSSLAQARAELATVAGAEQNTTATHAAAILSARAVPLASELRAFVRPTLVALFGAVLCLLLLACANLANLLLTRGLERERELAIRLALGGTRARIVRLFMTESLVLALVSGALGVLLAQVSLPLFTSYFPASLPVPVPGLDDVRVDRMVLAFALVASIGTALLFSAWPALGAARANPNDALKAEGGSTSGRGLKRRGRMLLISTELAFAVVLLIGAGLMTRSFLDLQRAPLGFTPGGLLTLHASLPPARYAEPARRVAYVGQLIDRLRALPGVEQAGIVDTLPLSGTAGTVDLSLPSSAPPGVTGGRDERPSALARAASADYFKTMAIPLRGGRLFTREDSADFEPVAIISETMARRYWPSPSAGVDGAIGQTFATRNAPAERLRVIGIVGDVRHWMGAAPRPTFYRPYQQAAPRSVALVLRTAGTDPMALAPAAQRAIHDVDALQPLRWVRTFDGDRGDQTWAQRLGSSVLGLFGIVALVLAATGVFGVMSTLVAQRTREIGIRTALGADPRAVVRLVLADATRWIGLGVALGVGGALLLTRYLASLLYGVTATDPLTFGGVAAAMLLVAVLASYLPARHASRIEPVDALANR